MGYVLITIPHYQANKSFPNTATHFVDGIIAYSLTEKKGETTVLGPLFHGICKVDKRLCTTQVGDGKGGFHNILIASTVCVTEMPIYIQAVLTPFLVILGFATVLSYCIGLVLLCSPWYWPTWSGSR